jgi:hypothetical protein
MAISSGLAMSWEDWHKHDAVALAELVRDKHAKYIMRIEAAAVLSGIGGGRGGFWEDEADYDWYAGI